MSKIGIVICTRTDSERVPNKPFRKINGVPLIEHLIRRLQKTEIPIYLAIPQSQFTSYEYLSALEGVFIHTSKHYDDPLARMYECADKNGLTSVIRVTHDKIFVEEKDVLSAVEIFNAKNLDYLYGTKFIPGTGFEIISVEALQTAAKKFKNIEYVGYSVRAVTNNTYDFNPRHPAGAYRFLIDFPEDLQFFEVLFSQVGNDANLLTAVKYLHNQPELKVINAQPKITVYTCAYNAAEYLEKCMTSVSKQKGFAAIEYILIDDHSTDKTCELMAKFCIKYPNAKWIRNSENKGLASSSNIALKNARGKYIMRIDADDYFVSVTAVNEMVVEIENSDREVIYPNNYYGHIDRIQRGKEVHHIGGAIFDKRAINHFKFTEGLRGYEGLDFFMRAKDQLKVGYLNKPMFFYTQRPDSLSNTNLEARSVIKKKIMKETIDDDFIEDMYV